MPHCQQVTRIHLIATHDSFSRNMLSLHGLFSLQLGGAAAPRAVPGAVAVGGSPPFAQLLIHALTLGAGRQPAFRAASDPCSYPWGGAGGRGDFGWRRSRISCYPCCCTS
eukprot:scaffold18172_cov43-Phaeocystis_antarctica.AAC.3